MLKFEKSAECPTGFDENNRLIYKRAPTNTSPIVYGSFSLNNYSTTSSWNFKNESLKGQLILNFLERTTLFYPFLLMSLNIYYLLTDNA